MEEPAQESSAGEMENDAEEWIARTAQSRHSSQGTEQKLGG